MNPLWLAMRRSFAPVVVFPIALVIGAIGYSVENYLRKEKNTQTAESFKEKREERRFEELTKDPYDGLSLKDFHYSKNKVLNREENISPSLSK